MVEVAHGWRAPVRIVLSATLLAAGEVVGLFQLGRRLDLETVLLIYAGSACAALAVEMGLALALGIAGRVWPARPGWIVVAAALPALWFTTETMFSGHRIRHVEGVFFIKLAVVMMLALVVRLGMALYEYRDAVARRARVPALVLLLAGWAVVSWADHRILVGQYTGFHALLAAGSLYAAVMAAHFALSAEGITAPRTAKVFAVLVAASVLLVGARWRSEAMYRLVTASNGHAPKLRQAATLARRAAFIVVGLGDPANRASETASDIADRDAANGGVESDEELLAEFRFTPTEAPEMDALRERVSHVVFVLLDGFRDDHLGWMDGDRSLTPHFDALAAESVRFTSAWSPSDQTGRSMPCLMTSLPLPVTSQLTELAIPMTSWITVLADAGLRTFNNGSDYVSRNFPHVPLPYCFGAEVQGTLTPTARGLEHEVVQFAHADGGSPFVAYTHWSDAHVVSHGRFVERYREMVGKIDDRIGGLVAGLQRAGVWDETLLVVTADHGYALGEGNRFQTGHGVAEYNLHIPLVVRAPGLAPREVHQNVSSHALVATILDVMAPQATTLVSERSLFGLLFDPDDPRRDDDHAVFATKGWLHALRVGDTKLVVDDRLDVRLVFDLATDPLEERPLVESAALRPLRVRLHKELNRLSRLSRALVAAHGSELDGDVMSLVTKAAPKLADVRPVLKRFASLDDRSRDALVEEILAHDLKDAAPDLLALTVDGWSAADQALLVLHVWAGHDGATQQLRERMDELDPPGRRWLSEALPTLPGVSARFIAEPLMEELSAIHAERPSLDSPAGRFLVRCARALPPHLRDGTPPQLKRLLVDLFNRAATSEEPFELASVAVRRILPRHLLAALLACCTVEDLPLLDELVLNADVGRAVPAFCLRYESPLTHEYVLRLIDRWDVPGDPTDLPGKSLRDAIPILRAADDADFRAEANRRIQARFPRLVEFE